MIEFSADLGYLLEAGECDRVMVLDESGFCGGCGKAVKR